MPDAEHPDAAAGPLRLKAGQVGIVGEPVGTEEDEPVRRLGGFGGQQRKKGQEHAAIVTGR